MKGTRLKQWSRLDNAAKIFPSNSTKQDTKVFRFACELSEDVDEAVLQRALDQTIKEFPLYQSILRHGLFWYYLESSTIEPLVTEEAKPPCSVLYNKIVKSLLFQVTYYKKRINLEMHHVLSDGTGALQFLRTLVYYYLLAKHGEQIEAELVPPMDYDASKAQKKDDSFLKYYDGKTMGKRDSFNAYQVRGERLPENRIRVIEGHVSAKKMVQAAHAYHTTVTALVVSLLICAIDGERETRQKRKPVVISVPVNLRNYFESGSARNFFSVINVGYDFSKGPGTLEDVIAYVSKSFREQLTMEKMQGRLNTLVSLERNMAARFIPLFVKDIVLRIANDVQARSFTGTVSNLGRIEMPSALKPLIRLFDVFISTNKQQICLCSFGDHMTIAFTSPFVSTDIQRRMFRKMTDLGIAVEIVSNQVDEE